MKELYITFVADNAGYVGVPKEITKNTIKIWGFRLPADEKINMHILKSMLLNESKLAEDLLFDKADIEYISYCGIVDDRDLPNEEQKFNIIKSITLELNRLK